MEPEVRALMESGRETISPAQAAKVLHCGAYSLNVLYKNGMLPFPAMMVGNRLKIIRIPFLKYLGYEKGEAQ